MNAALLTQAADLFCNNKLNTAATKLSVPEAVSAQTGASLAETEEAIDELYKLIRFCSDEIITTILQHHPTPEAARRKLYERAPELNKDTLDTIFRYSQWCVAKGA